MRTSLLLALPLAAVVKASYPAGDERNPAWQMCKALVDTFPEQTYWPEEDLTSEPYDVNRSSGIKEYDEDMKHRFPSSSQWSLCSTRPKTPRELSQILKLIAQYRPPFALKAGGCATEKGWSSTNGVMINMINFNSVNFKKEVNDIAGAETGTRVGTVTFGAGQAWSDVFRALDDKSVMIAGGRIVGVGVGGFILGGGYSWLSNRHGLSIDSVLSYELVTPAGEILHVAADSHPDLFFGLKGGFNNFGIITELTMIGFKQPQVHGGLITYDEAHLPQGLQEIANFQATNKDPEGNFFASYGVRWNDVTKKADRSLTIALWYNAPQPPTGFWDKFTSIAHSRGDLKTFTFYNYVATTSEVFENKDNWRAAFDSVSIPDLDKPALDDIVEVLNKYGPGGDRSFGPGTKVSATIEPFLYAPLQGTPRNDSAFAHDLYTSPLNINFSGSRPASDRIVRRAIDAATVEIRERIRARHPTSHQLPLYSNYALGNEALFELYGDNTYRLRELNMEYDPQNIMGLTGGYKLNYT